MKPLISRPRWFAFTRSTPAISRPSIHMLSAAPAMNSAISRGQNHSVTTPTATESPMATGPPTTAGRVPNRSISVPPSGCPISRPIVKAVTTCAANPPDISKSLASTGMMGGSIPCAKPSRSVVR